MEITLILDMKLTGEQETEFMKNNDFFFQDHIDVKNVNKNDYKITLVNTDLKPYSEYGFPKDVVEWLYSLKIYRLEYISDYTYAQIKELQVRDLNRGFISTTYMEFIPMLISAMKANNLRFKDIEINDLIPFRELNLSNRTINCFEWNEIFYIQDISLFTRGEISHLRKVGKKTQRELEEVMLKYGIGYKTDE